MKQAEKADATREAIFNAATKVVGRYGYAGASVGKITSAANVAQGTFYYHFKSRTELFDLLLPSLGEGLLRRIRDATTGLHGIIERQEKGFRTFFNFMLEKPEFYRILTEAEVSAPHAYETHMRNVLGRYLRGLTRSWDNGELPGFEKNELDMLAAMLAGAMSYLTLRYAAEHKSALQVPESVVRAYVKFVAHGCGIGNWERRVGAGASGIKRRKAGATRAEPNYQIAVPSDGFRRTSEDQSLARRDIGRAGELFGSGGADFLAIFVRECTDIIRKKISPAGNVWLRSFSQEIVRAPESDDVLVVLFTSQPAADDLFALTMLVEIAGAERIVSAVVSGVMGIRDKSKLLNGSTAAGSVLATKRSKRSNI